MTAAVAIAVVAILLGLGVASAGGGPSASDLGARRAADADPRPQAGRRLALDRFSRETARGWGRPTRGGQYRVIGTVADYRVTGGKGRMRIAQAGVTREAAMAAPKVRDVEIAFRVGMPGSR
jgi:hypothetical protein